MADPQSRSASERDRQLQEAFDRSAGGMDLCLESAVSPEGEVRAIGIAFIPNNVSLLRVELDQAFQEAAEDAAIEQVLHEYESLDPDTFSRRWKELAHDPHIGVGLHWISFIDEETIQKWIDSPQLRQALDLYPPFSPRKVTLEDLRIVYLSNARAVATYRVVETHQNGKLTAGNVVTILMKLKDGGWRIMVASKGGRFDTSDSTEV